MRNLEAKVPFEKWPEVKSAAWSAYTAASPKLAELLRDEFVRTYERELPAATEQALERGEFAALDRRLAGGRRRRDFRRLGRRHRRRRGFESRFRQRGRFFFRRIGNRLRP